MNYIVGNRELFLQLEVVRNNGGYSCLVL